MTQLIAAQASDGIVLAADSKGFSFDEQGNMQEVSITPLLALSPQTAVLGGGDADAAHVIESLQKFIRDEGVHDVTEVYEAALPFLNSEYERIMTEKCNCLPVDPVHHMYFILAGRNAASDKDPFMIRLIWNRKRHPQLEGEDIRFAFTVPRQMGLEYSLAKQIQEGATIEAVYDNVQRAMTRFLEKDASMVSAPLHMARIDAQGVDARDIEIEGKH